MIGFVMLVTLVLAVNRFNKADDSEPQDIQAEAR